MTQHIDTTDAVTVDDPRVTDLSDALDLTPQEVIAQATDAAATDGVTVGEELDAAEDVVQIMSAFGADDGTDLGDDGDDF